MKTQADALKDGPPCPPWCSEHTNDEGWHRTAGATVKHCRRVMPVDGGAEVTLERYAALEGYELIVQDPEIRVRVDEALSLADARTLADTIRRVTELVAETMVAA